MVAAKHRMSVGIISSVEERELVCLQSVTRNFVVSVRRSFLFLRVLKKGCVAPST